MTFLNSSLLIGLAALTVPIVLHLFNRRHAKVVRWGAMRFINASLIQRRRRVQIEEAALLALRCLLVACLVLAVARPFMSADAPVSWVLLIPLLLIASVVLAVATVLARSRRWRWLLYAAAAGLIVLAVVATQVEERLQLNRWAAGTAQDVVLIIDGSTSMTLENAGKTSFRRAIEEAKQIAAALGSSDTVSVVLAGIENRLVTSAPARPGPALERMLDDLEPVRGSLSVVDALVAATSALAGGGNATKRIVLITDGQELGWTEMGELDEALSDKLDELPTKPRMVCRVLKANSRDNASISSIDIGRAIVGTDRPVAINVRVENTGSEAFSPEAVELLADGALVDRLEVGRLDAGASEEVRFSHLFARPGPQVLTARIVGNDQLPHDDKRDHVVNVIDTLPVLLVDGALGSRLEDRTTGVLELALAPPLEGEPRLAGAGLIRPTVISAPDLDADIQLADYRAVVLADVRRLASDAAKRLARYVELGGGLIVAPGAASSPEFYNEWSAEGLPFMPGRLKRRIVLADDEGAVQLAMESLRHSAFQRITEFSGQDLDQATFRANWHLEANDRAAAQIGGKLESGDPLVIERTFGTGRITMLAVTLDDRGSNLPSLLSFLPLVHELIYQVATGQQTALNFEVAAEVNLRLPTKRLVEGAESEPTVKGAEVLFPSGQRRTAVLRGAEDAWSVDLSGATEPGVYEIKLPKEMSRSIGISAASEAGELTELPIAVHEPIEESRLEPTFPASAEDALAEYVDYFRADTNDQMLQAVIEGVPGHEVWRLLALGALLILVAEILVTRWIASQRRTNAMPQVDFTSEGERLSQAQRRAREFLDTARRQAS